MSILNIQVDKFKNIAVKDLILDNVNYLILDDRKEIWSKHIKIALFIETLVVNYPMLYSHAPIYFSSNFKKLKN